MTMRRRVITRRAVLEIMAVKKAKIERGYRSRRESCRSAACLALCCLLLSLFSLNSFAHQQKTALTRILFNANTGNIEVMHRFFIHDAEHAAGVVFRQPQRLLESAESRELFSSYVINRFAIETTDSEGLSAELALAYVGEEIDGQYLWVYQEAKDLGDVKALTVVSMALRDVWSDQTNLVNIEKDGQIYSLTFSDSAEMLSIQL